MKSMHPALPFFVQFKVEITDHPHVYICYLCTYYKKYLEYQTVKKIVLFKRDL